MAKQLVWQWTRDQHDELAEMYQVIYRDMYVTDLLEENTCSGPKNLTIRFLRYKG